MLRLCRYLFVYAPWALAALLLILRPCDAKIVSGSATLTGASTESTLTKFAMSPFAQGKAILELHSKDMYVDESSLRLHFYADADWKKVQKAPMCSEKIRLAKKSIPVVFDLNNNPTADKIARHKKKASRDSGQGLWEARIETTIPGFRTDRSQYWYLTLDDCRLEQYQHDSQAPRMEYTLTVWDETGGIRVNSDVVKDGAIYTHMPADEAGMSRLHTITMLFSFFLLLFVGLKIYSNVNTGGSVHAVLLIVLLATACDSVSSFFEIIHLRLYANNGIGSYSLDALSAHFEAMSDSLVALVLLSVGSGWTLPSDVLSGGSANEGFLSKLFCGFRSPSMMSMSAGSPAGILALSIIVSHAALAQWGRTFDEDFDCYHSLENPPGRALMWFRSVLGFAFLASVASVRNGGRCPQSLHPFLTKFAIVGISWFMSLPFISIFVAGAIPFHRRHQLLSAGSAFAQSCSLLSLIWLFTADVDASAYHRLSKVQGGGNDLTDMASSRAGGTSCKAWTFGKTKIRMD